MDGGDWDTDWDRESEVDGPLAALLELRAINPNAPVSYFIFFSCNFVWVTWIALFRYLPHVGAGFCLPTGACRHGGLCVWPGTSSLGSHRTDSFFCPGPFFCSLSQILRGGITPMHLACASGRAGRVMMLLQHGGRLDVKDESGRDAVEYAELAGLVFLARTNGLHDIALSV